MSSTPRSPLFYSRIEHGYNTNSTVSQDLWCKLHGRMGLWYVSYVGRFLTAIVTSVTSFSGSPFTSYLLFSFGYLVCPVFWIILKSIGQIAVVLVLPLSLLRLGQNIFVQLLSAAALICVFIIWVYTFSRHGLNNTVPVIGNNQTQLIGFVISNFAFVSPHVYMKFDSR